MRKSKINLRKTTRASVSVLLSFMMLPVYTFGAAVVDGVRISSARTMTEGAADMAVESGLSEFDSVLESVYGLFAVSSSEEELQKNLSDYFYRTVNNTALTEEDEEGRKYIDSLADIFSNPSASDFSNLVNLETENFEAEFTEGAVLANPEVLKSQITDYMKYTGPLKMSSGILSKLDVFSDFSNQNKAVSAKVSYDKSLERINSCSREIWNNASAYNKFISEGNFSGLSGINECEKKVREIYSEAVAELVMYRETAESEVRVSFDSDTEKYIFELADDAGQRVFDVAADMLARYTRKESGEDSELISVLKSIQNEYDDFVLVKRTAERNYEMCFVKTFSDVYFREYELLSDDEKISKAEEYGRVSDLSKLVERTAFDAWSIKGSWKADADMKCREAADMLCEFCTSADTAVEYLENIRDYTESLLMAADEAEKRGEKWQESILQLSEGDVKTSMQNEYDKGVRAVNRDDINAYLEITEKNLDAFKSLREYAESLKFYERSVCSYFNYSDEYLPLLMDMPVSSYREAENRGGSETACNLVFFAECSESDFKAQAGDYQFYRYLQEIYGGKTSETDKKSAQNFLKSIGSIGNSESVSAETPESADSDILSEISQKKLDKIREYLYAADENSEEFSADTSSEADAGSMLESQETLMNNTGELLQQIGELGSAAAGEGIDRLLVTEYIMQMFSCYTSEKECDGGSVKTVTPVMLSGVEMNSSNNVFYRSEAEYILWGNDNMEKNLEYTRALIFGTRFALNSVYAFTDSEIRSVTLSAATAIAGWTGFGVPVVKTVLILSLALAESVIDMEELLSGDSVPVYKNSSTWNMKPSGLLNALTGNTDEIVNAVTEKAGKKVEDIFLKIEASSENGVDSLTETVNGYVDELADVSSDAAVNTINNIIFSAAEEITDNAESTFSKENIRELIVSRLENSEMKGSDIESVIFEKFRKAAVSHSDKIAEMIYSCVQSAGNGVRNNLDSVKSDIAAKIRRFTDSLKNDVKSGISELSSSVKGTVSGGISSAGEYAEEYAKDIVGNMVTGAATELTEKFGGISADTAAKSPSSAASVTFTYKEYLRVFILLSSLSEEKERAMLSRTAVLIDINMNSGMKNAEINGKKLTRTDEFDISEAHSMVTVDAEASVGTWFLGAFTADDKLSDRRKIISVRSVLSY